MLSRVADSLYWLARYIERGECDEERPDFSHGVLDALRDAAGSRSASHAGKDG